MSTIRYRQDAIGELATAEREARSKRRSVRDSANPNTVRASEGTLPSLERRIEALRHEVATLPDRPSRMAGAFWDFSKFDAAPFGRMTPEQLEQVEARGIPDFLNRKLMASVAPAAEIEW